MRSPLLCLALVFFCAPGNVFAEPPPIPQTSAQNPVQNSAQHSGEENESRLMLVHNRFGFKLLAAMRTRDRGKNMAISPASIALCLGMVYNGAEGETLTAIARALELLGLERESVNRSYTALQDAMSAKDVQLDVQLSQANSLWIAEDARLRDEFVSRIAAIFHAEVQSFNIANGVAAIDSWVQRQTKGKIRNLITRIAPDDLFFAVNALYFRGKWRVPFERAATVLLPFHLDRDRQKKHPMMSQKGTMRYLETEEFQAVRLPYGSGRFGAYFFLPRPHISLESFLTSLDAESWEKWMRSFNQREGFLQVPRFKLEYGLDLSAALKSLGMGIAFMPGRANFRPIATAAIAIGEVKHKVFLEVNEEGTEAAAATSVGVMRSSESPFTMTVDRPFFFAIGDRRSRAILFMGVVFEPQT